MECDVSGMIMNFINSKEPNIVRATKINRLRFIAHIERLKDLHRAYTEIFDLAVIGVF